MRRRGGFTLIEIILVIMIVMLLGAIALPKIGSTMQHLRLRQGGREVASVMRLAGTLIVPAISVRKGMLLSLSTRRISPASLDERFW